jgi:hypothetical protein
MKDWSGQAADQFKKDMDAVTEQLASLGGYLDQAGKNMQIAGGIVGAFRGILRDRSPSRRPPRNRSRIPSRTSRSPTR